MTTALEGGEWSAARSGSTLHPGKTRYPLYRRLGGLQVRSGGAENLVPTGIVDSLHLDVVEKARVPDMLPSLFPSRSGKGLISAPEINFGVL